jgi:hypothetical protein
MQDYARLQFKKKFAESTRTLTRSGVATSVLIKARSLAMRGTARKRFQYCNYHLNCLKKSTPTENPCFAYTWDMMRVKKNSALRKHERFNRKVTQLHNKQRM